MKLFKSKEQRKKSSMKSNVSINFINFFAIFKRLVSEILFFENWRVFIEYSILKGGLSNLRFSN